MGVLYNILLCVVNRLLLLFARIGGQQQRPGKLHRFVNGQQGLLDRIVRDAEAVPVRPVVWFHVASLGEYGVARPLIKAVKERCDCTVVLTCFSPTAIEALKNGRSDIDRLYYLPLDTKSNVSTFLDAVRPDRAVFIISEYWYNYLSELHRRSIPTFLVSAIIRRDSVFFRWYGVLHRRILKAYTHIFVLDEESRDNLHRLGHDNVTLVGDPLFDNVIAVSRTAWHNSVIERFASYGPVFVAGSIHDKNDFNLVTALANANPDTRFIMVPHEISERRVGRYSRVLQGRVLRYSDCTPDTDLSDVQVLVIDFLGALAYLYRHATWAYVGGGFTPYLHSIIEATVYGVPVAFGPCIGRKVTPRQLISRRLGVVVTSAEELNQWFQSLKHNHDELQRISSAAAGYVDFNSGATATLSGAIIERL